jgi:DivIVA domain-containing protein
MPLTPAEVRAATFSTRRFRLGYDVDEVDQFLDQVEGDLAQLTSELRIARDAESILESQLEQMVIRVDLLEKASRETSPLGDRSNVDAGLVREKLRALLLEQLALLDRADYR